MVADDDGAIRDLLGTKLISIGYNVCFAKDASSAFSVACAEKPQAIILDRMLPGGDGLSVFRKLRAHSATENIPVLFLTAKRLEPEVLQALIQGAQDYIVKPFDVEEVVQRCTRLTAGMASKRGARA